VSEITAETLDPRARERFPIGWWGAAILIVSESVLFGMMIGTYFYLRFRNLRWPPEGVPKPHVLVPLVVLGCLIATAVPMQLASIAGRAGRLRPTRWLLVLSALVGAGYFGVEVWQFTQDLHTSTPQRDAYDSIYYTLLAADHAHVAVAVLLVLWLLWKLRHGFTRYRTTALRAIVFFWHAVIVLTIAVILTTLSPSFT
jgi:heme/copper-type cytochrome/quinol oxidase subunit 3